MQTATRTRIPPELKVAVSDLEADDDDLIAELNSLTDTCLRGARMERDAGLRIGELLTKKRGDPKKNWGFQKWVAKNCKFTPRMASKYMAAHLNFRKLLPEVSDLETWSLDELAQGKKYEPPAEPVIDIKVATTEHPIVVAPQPPQRPPCPGVEGSNPGEYKWSANSQSWLLIVGISYTAKTEYDQGQLVNKPTMSARDWLVDYLKFAKEDVIIEVLKTIRRCEHPDRGGNHNATVICNQYLEYMK